MIQQQQTLNLEKQKSPSKDTEERDAPNHSTGYQSPTGDILSPVDLEEDVDYQTGPKISESIAKRVEFKLKTKLTLDQLKEKSKNLLVPKNCPKLSVLLTNVSSQLNTSRKKADLRLQNLQKNIQKATIALVQVTDNLLQDKRETKSLIKNNLHAISILGHSLQDISTMRRQKMKSFLNRTCSSLCDLEYTDTQQLFGEHINKSLNRVKDVGNLKKQTFPETSRNTKSSLQRFPRTRTHGRNSFLYKSTNNQRGPPNKYKNH